MGCSSSRSGAIRDRGKCTSHCPGSLACATKLRDPKLGPELAPGPELLNDAVLCSIASLDCEEARQLFFRSPLGAELGKAIVNDDTWDFESKWNGHALVQVPGVLQLTIAVARERRSLKVLRYLQGFETCDAPPASPATSTSGSDISSLAEPENTRPISAGKRGRGSNARKRRWSKRQLMQQASSNGDTNIVRDRQASEQKSERLSGSPLNLKVTPS